MAATFWNALHCVGRKSSIIRIIDLTWDCGASHAPIPQEEGSEMDYKDLSPELREKAKACKTPEELLALAKTEGYKLSDEEMEVISGGESWSCTHCALLID